MKPVEYHPLALEELIDSAEYYELRAEHLGESFLDEVARAVADISESPERWPYFLLNSRWRLLDRFPYSIVYLIETEHIYILAVMHQRRRPGYWKKRLNRVL
jgi:plasmid stabilization system protein ParE